MNLAFYSETFLCYVELYVNVIRYILKYLGIISIDRYPMTCVNAAPFGGLFPKYSTVSFSAKRLLDKNATSWYGAGKICGKSYCRKK